MKPAPFTLLLMLIAGGCSNPLAPQVVVDNKSNATLQAVSVDFAGNEVKTADIASGHSRTIVGNPTNDGTASLLFTQNGEKLVIPLDYVTPNLALRCTATVSDQKTSKICS